MIVQVDRVEKVYQGQCEPILSKYRWWHKFWATDGTKYYLVDDTQQDIQPGMLLNIKPYPKSWVRKYRKRWGLSYETNYVRLV